MGRKANQAMIGAFVLGALLLGIAGVVVLSSDQFFFRDTQTLIAYFGGSLEGLDVGAPVTFNGVRIGSVTDLKVVIDQGDGSIRTPILFTIDAHRLHDAAGGRISLKRNSPGLEGMIEHGLRARLELQSLVTGQLAVALNFYPGTPVRLTGLSKHHPEMPTIPSSFDRLTHTLENLPVDALVTETIQTMRSVQALMTAPEVKAALAKLDRALSDFDGLVRNTNRQIDPLVATLNETARATQATMAQAQAALAQLTPAAGAAIDEYRALGQDTRKAVANADAHIGPLAASIEKAAAAAEATLSDARSVLGEDSPERDQLSQALQEITKAARSLRTLTDYLDRHPEAVIVGKRPEPGR
jgi:paraquat-inducible protein B